METATRYLLLLTFLGTLIFQAVAKCESDDDCSGHGECEEEMCFCDWEYGSYDCSKHYREMIPTGYYIYTSFNLILWTCCAAAATGVFLYTRINQVRNEFTQELSLVFLILGNCCRVVYYSITAAGAGEDLEPWPVKFFFGMWYPFLISVYALQVLIWAEFHNVVVNNKDRLNMFRLRLIFFIVCTIVFILEILTHILQAVRSDGLLILDYVYNAYLLLLAIAFIFGFMFFGMRLYFKLAALASMMQRGFDRFRRITILTVANSVVLVIAIILVIIIVAFQTGTDPASYLIVEYIVRCTDVWYVALFLYAQGAAIMQKVRETKEARARTTRSASESVSRRDTGSEQEMKRMSMRKEHKEVEKKPSEMPLTTPGAEEPEAAPNSNGENTV